MASIKEDSTSKWKFVILISKFVFHLIVASIKKVFGVLIDEMVVVFDTDVAMLGLLCSVPVALMLVACPIIAHLLAHGRGSPRVISLVGMTSGFGALMFSSYTRSCVLFGIYMTVLGKMKTLVSVSFKHTGVFDWIAVRFIRMIEAVNEAVTLPC
eukprot:XP_011661808.1 PREDICTED: uncharacterized protein LOC105437198 [Strongylocentrotus purpuratus]